jgi:hypothetical protein
MIGNGLGLAFLGYATFGIMLVLMSSCLVIFWAPAAAGGGVNDSQIFSTSLPILSVGFRVTYSGIRAVS